MNKYYLDEAFNQLKKLEKVPKKNIEGEEVERKQSLKTPLGSKKHVANMAPNAEEVRESIRRKRIRRMLDEAIPKDLANAYRKSNDGMRSSEDRVLLDTRDNDIDWQNVDYKELTPAQALQVPKSSRRKKVRIIGKDGGYHKISSSGDYEATPPSMRDIFRPSYEYLVKNAERIYYTDNENSEKSPIPNDKLMRRFNSAAREDNITGKAFHTNQLKETQKRYDEAVEERNSLKDNFPNIQKSYDEGKITRYEYNRCKMDIEDAEKTVLEKQEEVKEALWNAKDARVEGDSSDVIVKDESRRQEMDELQWDMQKLWRTLQSAENASQRKKLRNELKRGQAQIDALLNRASKNESFDQRRQRINAKKRKSFNSSRGER